MVNLSIFLVNPEARTVPNDSNGFVRSRCPRKDLQRESALAILPALHLPTADAFTPIPTKIFAFIPAFREERNIGTIYIDTELSLNILFTQ